MAALSVTTAAKASAATLAPHREVRGAVLGDADVRREGGAWHATAWDDLDRTPLSPGRYELRFRFASSSTSDSLEVPTCAGRRQVRIDARAVPIAPGPLVVPLSPGNHEVVVELDVSSYERRIACGEAPRVGVAETTQEGLGVLTFESPHAQAGGGRAVVYVPPGPSARPDGALLVGLHPWNGTIWTYAAYAALLREARANHVALLMPSGLGNSLYTADAEDEVLRAIDALASVVSLSAAADARPNVSIWGASMGGAGATTIAFHHPDRFAAVTSFFGDSQYDLATYVRPILRDAHGAHAVNALDIVDNARNLPTWLVHGEDDATSPIRQSEMLASAMRERGFAVRFDRVPGFGHAGALVSRFLPQVVALAASARMVSAPSRVSYWSVRPSDVGAYHVRIERSSDTGDAFVDAERRDDGIHVLRASGVRAIHFEPGALGVPLDARPRLLVDGEGSPIPVSWTSTTP